MQHHPVAAALAAAVARRDPQGLSAALTETVRLRALLPGGPVESLGRKDVAARFCGWFAGDRQSNRWAARICPRGPWRIYRRTGQSDRPATRARGPRARR